MKVEASAARAHHLTDRVVTIEARAAFFTVIFLRNANGYRYILEDILRCAIHQWTLIIVGGVYDGI